ncbi:RAD51C [Scenedesmus sp. PABB004]|nr:RAD51C [Scenedesmus sp. PABB004]
MPTRPGLACVALPVAPYVRAALLSAGLTGVDDLRAAGDAAALAELTGLSHSDAGEVLAIALEGARPGAVSAAELLARDAPGGGPPPGVSTGCAALDALLGGAGVACGTVTELFGVPGVGKTQMGMQLAVNVQLPQAFGGLSGKAIYIDTEGSFMPDRLTDMAAAAVARVQAAAAAAGDAAAAPPGLSVEGVLSSILYFRVHSAHAQLALARVLDVLLSQHSEVRLVVLDSATFHFRQDFPDAAARSRLLLGMAAALAAAAEARRVAVVMTNQVVTRIIDAPGAGGGGDAPGAGAPGAAAAAAAWLAPAGGEVWGQAAPARVALFWQGPQRYALLAKAKHLPAPPPGGAGAGQRLCVPYSVDERGITS